MKFKDLMNELRMMKTMGGMVKDLEYSPLNTLEQPRKDLHRNVILPEMEAIEKEMEQTLRELKDMLQEKTGLENVDNIDVDKYISI